jgi:hypothetical protein
VHYITKEIEHKKYGDSPASKISFLGGIDLRDDDILLTREDVSKLLVLGRQLLLFMVMKKSVVSKGLP